VATESPTDKNPEDRTAALLLLLFVRVCNYIWDSRERHSPRVVILYPDSCKDGMLLLLASSNSSRAAITSLQDSVVLQERERKRERERERERETERDVQSLLAVYWLFPCLVLPSSVNRNPRTSHAATDGVTAAACIVVVIVVAVVCLVRLGQSKQFHLIMLLLLLPLLQLVLLTNAGVVAAPPFSLSYGIAP